RERLAREARRELVAARDVAVGARLRGVSRAVRRVDERRALTGDAGVLVRRELRVAHGRARDLGRRDGQLAVRVDRADVALEARPRARSVPLDVPRRLTRRPCVVTVARVAHGEARELVAAGRLRRRDAPGEARAALLVGLGVVARPAV